MASSFVTPPKRPLTFPGCFPPNFTNRHRDGRGRRPGLVTADRTAGVGGPTLGPSSPAFGPVPALVAEAIATALDSIDLLEDQARRAARHFRDGRQPDGQSDLSQIVESTRTLLVLASTAADALGTTVEAIQLRHHLPAEMRMRSALRNLVHQQLAQDPFALAAGLEHGFVQALRHWRLVFAALGGEWPDFDPGHAA